MTTAQLKAKYQLAQMNHQSQGTDQTKEELAAAKDAYDAAAAKDAKASKQAEPTAPATPTPPATPTAAEGDNAQKKTE